MEGPTVVHIPVACPASRGDLKDLWVLDNSDSFGVKVVESPLDVCIDSSMPGAKHGTVTVAVEAGASLVVGPTTFPWKCGPSSSELELAASVSRQSGLDAARVRARESEQSAGWLRSAQGVPVLSVRLTDKCRHDPTTWQRKACGHAYCAVCDAYVCPRTQTVNKGPGPVIKCNRQFEHLSRYEHMFCEHVSQNNGTQTRLQSPLRAVLPKEATYAWAVNLEDKKIYEDVKKDIKGRNCLYRHWTVGKETPDDRWLSRMVSLCEMTHCVGDSFSILLDYPHKFLQEEDMKRLTNTPGVWVITLDGCKYGESSRHRQVVVTNLACLLWLSRDCDHASHPEHRDSVVGRQKWHGASKENQLIQAWIRLFRAFVKAPHDQHCSHCATLRGAPKQGQQPAIPLRRLVVEKLQEFDIEVPQQAPEVLFTAAREAILTVNLTPDSLGARLCSKQKIQKISDTSDSRNVEVSQMKVKKRKRRKKQRKVKKVLLEEDQSLEQMVGEKLLIPNPHSCSGASDERAQDLGFDSLEDWTRRYDRQKMISENLTSTGGEEPTPLVDGTDSESDGPPPLADTDPESDYDWESVVAWDDDEIMSMAQTLLGTPISGDVASEPQSVSENLVDGAEADNEDDGSDFDGYSDWTSEASVALRLQRMYVKALKGAHKSYKNENKKEKQSALFPELLKLVEEKRRDLYKGEKYPDYASRKTGVFLEDLMSKVGDKIGGTPEEQKRYFDEVIAKYSECFWIEGCAPPLVKDHKIKFRLKEGAKPVARQPIPLSPYDDVRVEYHIEENVAQGKLRKIDVKKEAIPEWSTPAFVVDQDAKGLMGRMVCAYGPVNKQLETSSFPSADPQRAFDIAAFKDHHTVVDAIWGYTQFELTEDTRRLLVICSRSGLYEWTRMPFGPSPAPAEMQGYVAQRFGSLRDKRGIEFCSPCMDDLKISSRTFEEHVEHMEILLKEARKSGFEFKATKGQYNQLEIEFWGVICDRHGRRVVKKKIDQLEKWPVPSSTDAVNSFLAFVNYLREHMDPQWIYWEQALRQYRKKNTDFKSTWTKRVKVKFPDGTKDVLPEEAFLKIRSMLAKDVVLHHVDFAAASDPEKSGRPLEMFVDASDYGWCATLCQRAEPQGAPKVVACIAKAFNDTQLRWSAMERELYALWKGVVGHERYLRGFKCFCYIDHKNNIFTEAQLDNRRRSKKMSNWALELQCFDIARVWIRGEANILGDAPSRAPWENAFAKFLPIPDGPVRQVINAMYKEPEALDLLVEERSRILDEEGVLAKEFQEKYGIWKEFEGRSEEILAPPVRGPAAEDGYVTPAFADGVSTPDFGESVMANRLAQELGRGRFIPSREGVYPVDWLYATEEPSVVKCCPGLVREVVYPTSRFDVPYVIERLEDAVGKKSRHRHWVIRWKRAIRFDGESELRRTRMFSIDSLGEQEAKRQAWAYFVHCFKRLINPESRLRGKKAISRGSDGPDDENRGFITDVKEGIQYHGDANHHFICYPDGGTFSNFRGAGKQQVVKVYNFDWKTCMFGRPKQWCNCHVYVRTESPGVHVYECKGHRTEERAEEIADRYVSGVPIPDDSFPLLEEDMFEPEEDTRLDPVPMVSPGAVGSSDDEPRALLRPGDPGYDLDEGGADTPLEVPRDLEVEMVVQERPSERGVPAVPGGQPVERADVEKAVRKRNKARSRKGETALDYWEPIPGRHAWVRHHVWSRRALFVPARGTKEGPDPDTLDDVRITHYTTRLGAMDVQRDSWRAAEPHRLLTHEWVGETWFFEKGKAPAESPQRRSRRLVGKQKPLSDAPEPEVLKQLVTGEGVNREGLIGDLGPLDIERVRLAAAQRADADFGELMVAHLSWNARLSDADVRKGLVNFRQEVGQRTGSRTIDGVLELAQEFEVIRGLLYRRVYDAVDGEVQLRLCVPDQAHSQYEYPGQAYKSLGYRERLILEYHNGPLGGHVGRERTYEILSKDFWWPGMYEDVRRWCKNCEQCTRERGVAGTTSFSRTQFYSRPFRVLQYDTVKCREEEDSGMKLILTVICCFSRWCWLIPLVSKSATEIAKGLFISCFLSGAMFPTVLRSDNAKEFVGEVSRELNKLLGLTHITGSSYHPQSQGMVESMHKTLNGLVRCLVEGNASEWEMMLPYAQCILRIMPMKVLGGRSPYEVVMGFRPRLPASLIGEVPVTEVSVDTYVSKLHKHFKQVYDDMAQRFKDHEEDQVGRGEGSLSAELKIGDLVLLRRNPSVRREGALRFQERVYSDIFRIESGSHPTFRLQVVGDPNKEVPVRQPVSADNLIKLDMPELQLDPNTPRLLELQDDRADPEGGWVKYRIEKYSVDGSVLLRNEEIPSRVKWVDLSKERYRWIL